MTVHPLMLLNASFSQPSGQPPRIQLDCQLSGVSLSGWNVQSLRLFLGDEHSAACDLYLLLTRYLKRILLTAEDNNTFFEIPLDCLKPVGFGDKETMLAAEPGPVPGHLVLQEYFLFPDKFLFFDLQGMEACRTLGNGSRFWITFELKPCQFPVPPIQESSFILSAVPVINLFQHKAKPMTIATEASRHPVRPGGKKSDHYCFYSVSRISEFDMEAAEEKTYSRQTPLLTDSKEGNLCHITHTGSFLGDGLDTWLSLENHSNGIRSAKTKLNIDLTCTNGTLPDQLGLGAIKCATATTPEAVEFSNIKNVTAAMSPDTGHNRHWMVLAGFSLNSLSLNGRYQLRSILQLFIPANCRDRAGVEAHNKRIEGIIGINALPSDRLIKGRMFRGYDIRLNVRGDHYLGAGDLFLFSSVLESFLGGYVTRNGFICFTVEDVSNGNVFEWPARLGDRDVL